MSGFGSCHGNSHCLVISHFSKQNNVWTLSERSTQGSDIIFCIRTNFTLAYDAFLMAVKKFKRVFKSNNMLFHCAVNCINDTGKRGGFSTSCRSGDKNQPFVMSSKVNNFRWNSKVRWIWKVEGDNPDDGCHRTSLHVGVDTKAGKTGDCKGKIIISGF